MTSKPTAQTAFFRGLDPFDFVPDFTIEAKRLADRSREAAFWGNPSIRGGREAFFKNTQEQRDALIRKFCRPFRKPFLRSLAKEFRVVCLSACKDSILMWSHYACYHSGLCIGFRPPQMRLPREKALRWKVSYRDERLPMEHPKRNEIALRKARAWRYEREWRIVMATNDLTSGERPLPRDRYMPQKPRFELGYFLRLQWDAIESVRFGALFDRRKRDAVLKTLEAKERRHITAVQMHLSVDKFALEEEILRMATQSHQEQ